VIEGVDPDMVERIQVAVNSYYGQFEPPAEESAEVAEPEAEQEVAGATAAEGDEIPSEPESESVTIEDTERPETK
jgi:hypothetical protein